MNDEALNESISELLAEAEDVFMAMAIEARIEAYRTLRKAELLSKELEDMAAKQAARQYEP